MNSNSSQRVSLAEVRRDLRASLTPKYGEREATAMARIILQTLKGWTLPELIANEERPASDYIKERSKEILAQLLDDMPLQYSLGETTFYGLKLKVNRNVLIPRPETEELVDLIVKENRMPDLDVADIGTGSGAIALALARNLPFSKVLGIDISSGAIEVAKENAESLKIRMQFKEADILKTDIDPDSLDIIVSNPPYIEEFEKKEMAPNVLKYEPAQALFVPVGDPLVFYKRLAEIGIRCLRKGGRLFMEINPLHSAAVRKILSDAGYSKVEIIMDIHGKERFAKAVN